MRRLSIRVHRFLWEFGSQVGGFLLMLGSVVVAWLASAVILGGACHG